MEPEKLLAELMRECLSPEAIATIVALLQPAAFQKPANETAREALRQVEWFASLLTDAIGVAELDRHFNDLCL